MPQQRKDLGDDKRRQQRSAVVAAMQIGRGNRDILSQTEMSRIQSDLSGKGWIRLSEIAEQFANAGPKKAVDGRLKRACEELIGAIRLGCFVDSGLLVDARAPHPLQLTPETFSTLVAHLGAPQSAGQLLGVDLLDICWIDAPTASKRLGMLSRTNQLLPPRRRPGRRNGQGRYRQRDLQIVEMMREPVSKGQSVRAAALKFLDMAEGAGLEESTLARLMKLFRATVTAVPTPL